MSKWTFETEAHTKEKTWGIWDDEGGGEVVCQHVQTLEHARLIAAAPELLAAVTDAIHCLNWETGEVFHEEASRVLVAAYEKATKEEA